MTRYVCSSTALLFGLAAARAASKAGDERQLAKPACVSQLFTESCRMHAHTVLNRRVTAGESHVHIHVPP
jgi:hypothetical protein